MEPEAEGPEGEGEGGERCQRRIVLAVGTWSASPVREGQRCVRSVGGVMWRSKRIQESVSSLTLEGAREREGSDMRTVCVDFDGVLNTYTGWKGEGELFEPQAGAEDFLVSLVTYGYRVVIFTTRPSERVWEWLCRYDINDFVDDVTSVKPPATAYIDDRSICFKGSYQAVLEELDGFKTWWEVSNEHT